MTLVSLLSELVAIPSPNPAGDTMAIAAFIAQTMQAVGCEVRVLAPESKPQAQSVVATLGQGEPVIMLHAHIDTVPIAEEEAKHWTSPPNTPTIRDGRLYGKGSVDDKAPLAAMMQVMIETAPLAASASLRGTLVLVAAAEEETGGRLGTRWLAESGHLPDADFIIVGEQTHNHAAAAHKGVLRATVRTTGRSVHATNPDRGINAITAMARVILALESYHQQLAERLHPLVGVPTCNVGVVKGGSTANAVPDTCAVYLDRRMIPGEDPQQVMRELEAVVSAVDIAPASAQVGEFQVSNWFQSTLDSPLARVFMDCIQSQTGENPGPIGYLPGSDAKHLMALKRGEMVIFGPGSYEVAHAFDEYVDLEELHSTWRILADFIAKTVI